MGIGSHSPITVRLTELFGTSEGLGRVTAIGTDNLVAGVPLVDRAAHHNIVRNDFERDHLEKWPADQQAMMRALLIHSIREGRPIVFDWEEDTTTSTTVMDFGETLAVTFRSPRDYPPYKK